MSSRRLVQRRPGAGAGADASGSNSSSTRPAARPPTTELPPYQEPACPMNAAARAALRELSVNRETRPFEDHIKYAIKNLGHATAGVQDNLRMRRERLEFLAEKTAGGNSTPAQLAEREELTAYAAGMEREVDRLTVQAEETIRELIDVQARLDDEKALLANVHVEVATQQHQPPPRSPVRRPKRPHRELNDEDEDTEMEEEQDTADQEDTESFPRPKGPLTLLSEGKKIKAAEYAALDMHRRYGLSNDYAAFKKLWHDAAHSDDVPLPNATRWFTADGEPVMVVRRRTGAAAGDRGDEADGNDEDEDLIIQRETISYKCPLSMEDLHDPLTSRLCGHTYEKAAVLDYLGHKVKVRCPNVGCDKEWGRGDLYRDEAFVRKMERHRKREEAQQRMDEDEDEIMGEADTSLAISGTQSTGRKPVKQEARIKGKGRADTETIEDSD